MKKRNYKYKIGQTIINPQVGAVKVTYRWKAKRYNFYDVLSIPVASGNNMQCKNNPRCTHL